MMMEPGGIGILRHVKVRPIRHSLRTNAFIIQLSASSHCRASILIGNWVSQVVRGTLRVARRWISGHSPIDMQSSQQIFYISSRDSRIFRKDNTFDDIRTCAVVSRRLTDYVSMFQQVKFCISRCLFVASFSPFLTSIQ